MGNLKDAPREARADTVTSLDSFNNNLFDGANEEYTYQLVHVFSFMHDNPAQITLLTTFVLAL